MPSYSRVIIIGNLVRDPEVRYTPSGTAVANMRVAVNHRVKRGGEVVEEVSFFDVVAFGRTAQASAEFLEKGSMVFVDGSLRERRWETQDGQRRSKIEIIADTMRFLSPRKNASTAESPPEEEEVIEEPE